MRLICLSSLVFVIVSCQPTKNPADGEVSIDTVSVASHLQVLSSDEYEGRKPFTEGEEKTVQYLEAQFRKMGLAPGNGDSYIQEVPMVEITAEPDDEMVISGQTGEVRLDVKEEFVVYTEIPEEETKIERSELVFAGFGIVAPEYNWNDYEGLDVTGKTVIVLVNDPGFGSGDPSLFKGETMTYYGRWTYKYEEAARQGAAGVLIVHETIPAGYPWLVVRNSWSGAKLNLDVSAEGKCAVQGWITRDAAIKIFEASGKDMRNFTTMARSADFEPFSLGLEASVGIRNSIKRDVSKNVIAEIRGTEAPDEAVVYSAHWDHLGIGQSVDGDSIYNGALDNASGTAVLLGLAEAFKKTSEPKRTIAFLAVTAEEQGLLGSQYYCENPTYSPEKMVANINMDGASYYGPMKDLTVIGYGQSNLDDMAQVVAEKQGRYLKPDPDAGKGYFFRSDHFNFAKIGVPAFYASADFEAREGGVASIQGLKDAYLQKRYHRPQDEYEAVDWQYGGLLQDGMLYYELGSQLANSNIWPEWKDGSEFKSLRE